MCFKSFLLHKLICIVYLLKYLSANVTLAFYIYMFNFIYIYCFIPMSDCVGMGRSALLFPGARDAVKTALLLLLLSKKQLPTRAPMR
jgi:hypothetical protein